MEKPKSAFSAVLTKGKDFWRKQDWWHKKPLREKELCGFVFAVLTAFLVLLVVCLGQACLGDYFLVGSSLFFEDASDILMDFFNVNEFVADMNPYYVEGMPGEGSSYPPLVLLCAKLFQLVSGSLGDGRATRLTARGILAAALFLAAFYVPARFLLRKALRNYGLQSYTNWLYTALVLTAPMLFLLNRGNYLFYVLLFLAVFLLYRNHEKAWVRELSYLSLGFAVGFKLYPAVFGLILLKEKKILPLLRAALYSILLVVLPFACFRGGWANIGYFLENMTVFSSQPDVFLIGENYVTNAFSNSLSVSMVIRGVWAFCSGGSYLSVPAAVTVFGYLGMGVVLVSVLVGTYFADSTWKVLLLCAAATVSLPDPSYFYGSTVVLLALIAFFSEEKKGKMNVVYFILFLVALLPLPLGYFLPKYSHGLQHGYTVANFLQGVDYLVFSVLVCVEGVLNFRKERRCKSSQKTNTDCRSL